MGDRQQRGRRGEEEKLVEEIREEESGIAFVFAETEIRDREKEISVTEEGWRKEEGRQEEERSEEIARTLGDAAQP